MDKGLTIITGILLFLFAGCTPLPAQRGDVATPGPEETSIQPAETEIPASEEADETSASQADEVGEESEEIIDEEGTPAAGSAKDPDEKEETPVSELDDAKAAAKSLAEFSAGEGVVLIYKRSGGKLGLEEAFTVYEDGRLTSDNEQAWQANAGEVERLLDEIGDLDFFEMEGTYLPDNLCCDRFSYVLSVIDGEEIFTVRTIDAAPGTPDELWLVLDLVQKFVDKHT